MLIRTRAATIVVALASGVAAAGFAATPAHAATFGTCDVTTAGLVYTLTADCEVTSAIEVPDGVTFDGAGNTITAVETPSARYAGYAVLRSAVGDDSAAATMNVKNLHIETNFTTGGYSGGNLFGIYMSRAGGVIDNVSVDGISHGNGGQEGRAIYISNLDSGGTSAVPEADVTITDTTISRYQKSGLYFFGNVNFAVSGLTVGRGAGPNGEANDGIAANAVTIRSGAHGSLTDSLVAPNFYKGRLTADDDYGTGILILNAGKVTLARNIVTGIKGNVGISVSGDSGDVTMSCSQVRITGAQTTASIGVISEAPATLAVRDSSVSGFATATDGVTPTVGHGDCLAPAPKVKAYAGDHAVDVLWTRSPAPAYAPASGQVVVLSAAGQADRTVALDAAADSATFTGLTGGVTYTATVRVTNVSGNAVASATAKVSADPVVPAVAQKISLSRNHTKVVKGHTVVFTGKLTPARLGITVELLTRNTSGHWVVLKKTVVKADSTFRFTWKATKPYGTHHFKVRSAATTGFLSGLTPCRDVKVTKH